MLCVIFKLFYCRSECRGPQLNFHSRNLTVILKNNSAYSKNFLRFVCRTQSILRSRYIQNICLSISFFPLSDWNNCNIYNRSSWIRRWINMPKLSNFKTSSPKITWKNCTWNCRMSKMWVIFSSIWIYVRFWLWDTHLSRLDRVKRHGNQRRLKILRLEILSLLRFLLNVQRTKFILVVLQI